MFNKEKCLDLYIDNDQIVFTCWGLNENKKRTVLWSDIKSVSEVSSVGYFPIGRASITYNKNELIFIVNNKKIIVDYSHKYGNVKLTKEMLGLIKSKVQKYEQINKKDYMYFQGIVFVIFGLIFFYALHLLGA